VGGKRHTVQLVVYDDESNAATSERLTQKLIATDKVQFLLGPYSSPITFETSLVSEKHRILTVAALANADAIYERRFQYVVSVLPPATTYMKHVLEMARTLTPQPKTVAIMAVGSAFGIQVADGALGHATSLGYQIVNFEKYPQGATDVSALLKQIKAANPDVLLASFEEAALIVKSANQLSRVPRLLALARGPEFPGVVKSRGEDPACVYGSAWWLPNMGWRGRDCGGSRAYAKAMAKRPGQEPSYLEAAGTAAGL